MVLYLLYLAYSFFFLKFLSKNIAIYLFLCSNYIKSLKPEKMKKIIVFIVFFVLIINIICAQRNISIKNYDYMLETPKEDSLFWKGLGDITPKIFLDMINIQRDVIFYENKKLIHWINESIIASAIEENKEFLGEREVVVLFYFPKGRGQRVIFYKYPYNSTVFSENNIDEEFLLYLDYCQNNLFGEKTENGGWLNISMYPKSVFCSKEMNSESLSEIRKYPNLYNIMMDLSY